jgi:hypothetical protein
VWPRAVLPVYIGLTILSYPIGFVLSYVILGTVFFLVITPTGLVMRLLGKDPLDRAAQPEAAPYRTDSPPARSPSSFHAL